MAAHGGTALLAKRGFHAPLDILTEEHGFFASFAGYIGLANQAIDGLGKQYLIRQIAYKRFAVGGPDQAPLYAFLQILRAHKLGAEDIDFVEVYFSREAFATVATFKHPSVYLPTVLGLAAVFGEVTYGHTHKARYYDAPRVKAFEERVKLLPHPGLAAWGERMEARVAVRTTCGQTIRQERRYPLMTEEEIQQKFRTLVSLRVPRERALDIEQKIKGIESMDNVDFLVSSLEAD